jgi:putative nucleotidyltransferase with HDIG domain
MSERHPPRLLVKTLTVAFITVATLLGVMFVVVTLSVRTQVRRTVAANLESTQRLFAAVETRRQRELRAQAETLADNATLKAALDTYLTETRGSRTAVRADLLETIDLVLEKVAARVDSDAVVLVDTHQMALAAAGRMANRWPRRRAVSLVATKMAAVPASSRRLDRSVESDSFDGVARIGDVVFRVVTVPLLLDDAMIGTLYVATSLDREYAQELERLAGNRIAIISDGLVLATTLSPAAARQFESAVASERPVDGTLFLDGESYAFRRLVLVGDTVFYALGSIDESSSAAMRDAMESLALTGVLGIGLAAISSFWLARLLSEPIGALSNSLAAMAASHNVKLRLPVTGSSRELDTLTHTFNALMASVAEAEAQTQSAYTGAIRALASALDARDPYTGGHSDRVSVLSVAICKQLNLPPADIEVVRLGALLHDIGKIGVPDDVLRKPGALTAAEFDIIKQHPIIGARMLRSVPFLAPHIPIVELHHERPDGRGYPRGLRGDDIPLDARIVHVADAYDAMTSARAYRGARPSSEALRELWRCAGTEFHAEIVAALANALPGVTSDTTDAVLEQV